MVLRAVSKRFRPGLNAVHVKDLNFILHLEIFMYYDGQHRASHLILDCVPSYTSYQDPGPALIVSSLLLSYIDVHLPRFLPRGLTIDEAWARGPRFIREGSLLPVRDSSVNTVFHGRAEHCPVEDLAIPEPDNAMVEQRNMNIRHFSLGAQPTEGQVVPQQSSQQTPPATPRNHDKRPRSSNKPSTESGSPPSKHTHALVTTVTMTMPIPDKTPGPRQTEHPVIIGSNMASTSSPFSSGW